MTRLVLGSALTLALAAPAAAQEVTWWDLIDPNRLMEQVATSAVFALRTQVDLTYESLDISLLDGTVSLRGLDLLIPAELTESFDCPVRIDRIELSSEDPFDPQILRFSYAVTGLSIEAACLPPDAAPAFAVLGSNRIEIPRIDGAARYDVPSGGFSTRSRSEIENTVLVETVVDFDYAWFREDGNDPLPVLDLSSAMISVEDLGGWARVAGLLPPDLVDPATAEPAMVALFGEVVDGWAFEGRIPKEAKAFVQAFGSTWAEFVAAPQILTIESGFDPASPRVVDVDDIDRTGPLALIELLSPLSSVQPGGARQSLAAVDVQTALAGEADTENALEVGLALLEGQGVPRNPEAAEQILTSLARQGNSAAALPLARAILEDRPEEAYRLALEAANAGATGTGAVFDAIDLPLADRLRLQEDLAPNLTAPDLEALSRSDLTRRAEAFFNGEAAPQSFRNAALLAGIAAAEGDRAATTLLDRLSRRVARADQIAQEAWAPIDQDAADLALAVWLARTAAR